MTWPLRYRLVRVWRVPAAPWLAGGRGLLPLVPLGDVRQEELPAVISQMKERLEGVPPRQAADLWSAAYIWMGLRYERALIQMWLRGVRTMKESVTYQAIIEEGEAKEARKIVLLQGRNRFGEASPQVVAILNGLSEVSQLEELLVRLLHVSSWEELLGLNRDP